jgi:hypothetical protein
LTTETGVSTSHTGSTAKACTVLDDGRHSGTKTKLCVTNHLSGSTGLGQQCISIEKEAPLHTREAGIMLGASSELDIDLGIFSIKTTVATTSSTVESTTQFCADGTMTAGVATAAALAAVLPVCSALGTAEALTLAGLAIKGVQ